MDIKKLIKDYLNQREMMGLPVPDIFTKSQGLTKAKGSPLQWMIHQERMQQSMNSEQQNINYNISTFNIIPEEYRYIRLFRINIDLILITIFQSLLFGSGADLSFTSQHQRYCEE